MLAVNHRFALSSPTLVSALSKKIILQGQWPNLGLEYLNVDWWLTGLLVIEYLSRRLQKF